jgi:hypothetical protein
MRSNVRLAAAVAFIGIAAVLAAALVASGLVGGSTPSQARDTRGCFASSVASDALFCIDVRALTAPSERAALTNGPGLLDQLPACGSQTASLPSFCIEPPKVSALPTPLGHSVPPDLSGGDRCAGQSRGAAPIFCLGVVAAPHGPAERREMIRYVVDLGHLNTREVANASAYLEIDTQVDSDDTERLRSAAEADVRAVESFVGRSFATPPTIFVLATRSRYAAALEHVLGYEPANAATLAEKTGGLYVSDPSVVFVNWQNVRSGTLFVLRHELTHALIRETVGPRATVPAWVDEGLATLAQETVPGRAGPNVGGYAAVALLARQDVTLDDLSTLAEWPARNTALHGYAYEVAAQGARELVHHLSLAVLVQILSAEREGGSFADAYQRVTGEPFAAFVASFARRVSACGPGIAAGPAGADRNVLYVLHGYGPNGLVRIAIDGDAGYHVGFDAPTDDYGMYAGTFGATAPAGRYEISAVHATGFAAVALDTNAGAPAVSPAVPTGLCGD